MGLGDRGLQGNGRLENEGRIFARYLLGREAAPELVERYAAANRRLLRDAADPRDGAVLGFVYRHPWSLSLLDAACALLRPAGLLRTKLLIMAAILETSPAHAADFLPRSAGTAALFARLAGLGVLAAGRAIAGVLLYLPASRARP